jgi:hypothetical protein
LRDRRLVFRLGGGAVVRHGMGGGGLWCAEEEDGL